MNPTALPDDRLFLATDRVLRCVDGNTGREYWMHQYPVRIDSGSTDICRWGDVIVVAASRYVIAVAAANGAGVFLTKLPNPFGGSSIVRVLARRDRLVVYDSIAIAGVNRAGVVEWLHQLAPSYPVFMPSVLWGDVARGGVERTFDRR